MGNLISVDKITHRVTIFFAHIHCIFLIIMYNKEYLSLYFYRLIQRLLKKTMFVTCNFKIPFADQIFYI